MAHDSSLGEGAVDVLWTVFGAMTPSPMGLQRYELEIAHAFRALDATRWRPTVRRVGGLRASPRPDTRLPLRRLMRASVPEARALGRLMCRGSQRVHRFDLRLPPAPGAEIVTVHDLPPLRFPDEGRLARWSITTAADADLIICPSQFAADEAELLLGARRIAVVPNGVASSVFDAEPLSEQELAALGIPPRFVLHAGGATRRKNLASLAEAWRIVGRSLPSYALVLLGPEDPRRDAAFSGVSGVRKLGWQAPPVVARLMRSSACVVVPSTYEGFGLPALEGMAAGVPVVAAKAGALTEVCEDAAILTGTDPASLADGIHSACRDEALRATLTARGLARAREFTWARTAHGHNDAYEAAFAGR